MNQDNIVNLSPEGKDIIIEEGAEDIFIGEGCSNIYINAKCKWIHIGDNCTAVKVVDSMYVEMYSNNSEVNLDSVFGVQVGYNNIGVNGSISRGVIIGRDCSGLRLKGADGNNITRSSELNISSKNNLIEDSTGLTTDTSSMYTVMRHSGELDVKKSLSTNSDGSQLVEVSNSDNTTVQASDLKVLEQRPFRKYITKDNNTTICKLEGDLSEYNVDKANGDIKMTGVNNLLDCPRDDEGVYARYKGQWVNINDFIYGPKDDYGVYAVYNQKWVKVKAVDPSMPLPDPPKAVSKVDPDTVEEIVTPPASSIVKQ